MKCAYCGKELDNYHWEAWASLPQYVFCKDSQHCVMWRKDNWFRFYQTPANNFHMFPTIKGVYGHPYTITSA